MAGIWGVWTLWNANPDDAGRRRDHGEYGVYGCADAFHDLPDGLQTARSAESQEPPRTTREHLRLRPRRLGVGGGCWMAREGACHSETRRDRDRG